MLRDCGSAGDVGRPAQRDTLKKEWVRSNARLDSPLSSTIDGEVASAVPIEVADQRRITRAAKLNAACPATLTAPFLRANTPSCARISTTAKIAASKVIKGEKEFMKLTYQSVYL